VVKQVQRSNNKPTVEKTNNTEENVTGQQPEQGSRNFVESVGSVPNQLYERLGLTMPRWLFWFLTIGVGITLSGILVSSLALWTPLWSNVDKENEELGASGKETQKAPMPGELWSNISQYQLSRPMNILVMGIEPLRGTVDGSPESFAGNSDTMLLVRLNPTDKTIRVLSVPRDTMIAIPEGGLTKVSQANRQGGPVLAARVMSRSLSNAPIDRYIRISTSGLRQLVDQFGGVEVFVPEAMGYQGTSGQQPLSLVSGWQTLNGEQAELFARFRKPGKPDLDRVQRQQLLLEALRERLSSPTVVGRLPQLTRVMRKYFDTNLKMEEMLAIVNFSLNLERDNFQMTMLPGTFSSFSADPESYWLNLTGQVGILEDFAGVSIAGMERDNRPLPALSIAVQNASKKSELQNKALNFFKSRGFAKVSALGNWQDIQRETKIIVQKGNLQAGKKMQQFLGFGRVEVAATGEIGTDLTIRVGEDWNPSANAKLPPQAQGKEQVSANSKPKTEAKPPVKPQAKPQVPKSENQTNQ
jgi:polyisoprenyl-teichoic acid--peptidoglycan teichoic acid transferase